MTDSQWEVLGPEAEQVMAELRRGRGGRATSHDPRAMLDAIGYLTKYGVQWRALPADFPRGRRCMRSSSGGMPGVCRIGWLLGCAAGCGWRRDAGVLPTPVFG
jgi:transposase